MGNHQGVPDPLYSINEGFFFFVLKLILLEPEDTN